MSEEHGYNHLDEGMATLKNANYVVQNIEAFIRTVYANLDTTPLLIVREGTFEEYGLDHCLTGLKLLKSIDYDVELIIDYVYANYPNLDPYDPFATKVKKK